MGEEIALTNFREATVNDIRELHLIRMAVKENILPHPLLITEADYEIFLTIRGKGWLCEVENNFAGFAIIDLKEKISGLCLCIPTTKEKALANNYKK